MDFTATYNDKIINRKAYHQSIEQSSVKFTFDASSWYGKKSIETRLKRIDGVRGEPVHIEILQAQKGGCDSSAFKAKHFEVQEVHLFELPSDRKSVLVVSVPDPFS